MNKHQVFQLVEKANALVNQAKEGLRDKELVEANNRIDEALRIKQTLTNALKLNKGAAYEVIRDAIGTLSF